MSTRGHTATCMTMVLSRSLSPPPLPFSLSHVHKGSQEYLQSPHMYSKHIQWRYRGISSLFAAEIGKVEVSNSSSAGYTRVDTTNLRHTASSDKLTIYSHVKCHNLTLECTPTWAMAPNVVDSCDNVFMWPQLTDAGWFWECRITTQDMKSHSLFVSAVKIFR